MDKLTAFLDLIAFSEGTSSSPLTIDRGYDVIVTGVDGPAVFTGYDKHPFENGGAVTVRNSPLLISTAAGRYQLLARYWRVYKIQLGLPDYSPASQDKVAIQQIRERAGLALITVGNIQGAIEACSNIWASFPGNNYGQGGHDMSTLLAKYSELVGA
jgi:muramidase (phage lysozyme)